MFKFIIFAHISCDISSLLLRYAVISAILFVVPADFVDVSHNDNGGGWNKFKEPSIWSVNPVCNLDVIDGTLVTPSEFISRYAYKSPVIIKNASDNKIFADMCSKQNISKKYGDVTVRLSSSNSYSYEKVDIPFSAYLEHMLYPMDVTAYANETFYFFGDVISEDLNSLLEFYVPPSKYFLPNTRPALSFGIAGKGTGVQFHFHGPGFGEVIYGIKHWFFYPPSVTPDFHPNETTLYWYLHQYQNLDEEKRPLECSIGPGDLIYFPDRWWHGTLNLDTTVFISTFLGPN